MLFSINGPDVSAGITKLGLLWKRHRQLFFIVMTFQRRLAQHRAGLTAPRSVVCKASQTLKANFYWNE
jgi:hypothetical protein